MNATDEKPFDPNNHEDMRSLVADAVKFWARPEREENCRVKILCIPVRMLVDMVLGRYEFHGLPEDAKVVAAMHSYEHGGVLVKIHSETFPIAVQNEPLEIIRDLQIRNRDSFQELLLKALMDLGVDTAGRINDPRRWSVSDLVKDLTPIIRNLMWGEQEEVPPGNIVEAANG